MGTYERRRQPSADRQVWTSHVRNAKSVLRAVNRSETDSIPSPDEIYALVLDLENEHAFGLARRLLDYLRDPAHQKVILSRLETDSPEFMTRLAVEHAICTYQDPDLPADERLDRALEILKDAGPLDRTCRNLEVMETAGAIYKRKWDVDGHSEHLEVALGWYLRGHYAQRRLDRQTGLDTVPVNLCATSINAAYILDLLAARDEETGRETGGVIGQAHRGRALKRREQACDLRTETLQRLIPLRKSIESGRTPLSPRLRWSYYTNIGESYFGIGKRQWARRWLIKARELFDGGAELAVPPWYFETTARQLANIARLRPREAAVPIRRSPGDVEVLRAFLKNREAGLSSLFNGKVGLALSGGGFRASLFHIGVLAHLAERDLLRHVEVLSCVSGGSIIGAYYYLKLRERLERRETPGDAQPEMEALGIRELDASEYLDIVEEIQNEFMAAVQRNVRARVLTDLGASLKMVFYPYFTRTERMGDWLDRLLFLAVSGGSSTLRELAISAKNGVFNPRMDNWSRSSKIPILLLNATTLNTGHNWQFAVTWMGEPRYSVDPEIDPNHRLRRVYYHEAPLPHNDVRLGRAVAASACVPGFFEPIALPKLYHSPFTARLVDGGVHDNQGIAGLLEQSCNVLLVSDASGQLTSESKPRTDMLSVLFRTNQILMARVREAQMRELRARRRSGVIRSLMVVHLRKQLDAKPVAWLGCDDLEEDEATRRAGSEVVTEYGMRRDVQSALAKIRTDLDSFSEAEGYTLMLSGYLMCREYAGQLEHFPTQPVGTRRWKFLDIQAAATSTSGLPDPATRELLRALSVGHYRMFKPARIPSAEGALALFAVFLTVLVLAWGGYTFFEGALPQGALLRVGQVLAATALAVILARTLYFRERPSQVANSIVFGLLGLVAAPFAALHLLVFHSIYLKRCSLARLARQPGGNVGPPRL